MIPAIQIYLAWKDKQQRPVTGKDGALLFVEVR